jgi:1-acyl-sn-glycerol-3-phosphate acyltransferase
MSLKPLSGPTGLGARVIGHLKGWPAAGLLFVTVLLCNALQMLSLVFWPVSRPLVRRINREIANAWWSLCDLWAEHLWKIDIEITGDEVPHGENALVISNHRTMADITTLFRLARRKGRLGDLKWFAKDVMKYMPGVGWGMVFLDCIFLKRDWNSDREALDRTFGKFKRDGIDMWAISFVEGTRLKPHKLARSQAYAEERGLPRLEHLLLPRTKGFVATVDALRDHLHAVYDVTIAYEDGVPSLWQWVQGYVRKVHLHVRRFPMAELPLSNEELSEWLYACYQEKDARLARHFATSGRRP